MGALAIGACRKFPTNDWEIPHCASRANLAPFVKRDLNEAVSLADSLMFLINDTGLAAKQLRIMPPVSGSDAGLVAICI